VGETTYQIEHHIEKTRDSLGANLNELEYKVKEIADWRYHFRNHPLSLMGAAFGGGILLATMMSGRRRNATPAVPFATAPRSPHAQKAVDTWDHIKDALIGVAAGKVTNFVGELVPGFEDEFRKVKSSGRM
jgi:hypothetical protein